MKSRPDYNKPEEHEERLVLRPVVKYIAIGLAVATILGVEYASYRFGVERGYAEGVASGEVTKSVNDRAIENLRHFMQVSSADDSILLTTARNYRENLAWIQDESVRTEAIWTLAQALVTRGLVEDADALVRDSKILPTHEKTTSLWVRRALIIARAFAAENKYVETLYYYDYADDFYARNKANDERLKLITERIALLQASVTDADTLQKELSVYAERAAALGDKGHELVAGIWVNKGHLYRAAQKKEDANKCFEKALKEVNTDQLPELASAAICVGSLLLEKGDTERAEGMLRDGLKRVSDSPDGAPYMLLALRDLARIEQEKGNTDLALALLYRAEGVAMTTEPENSIFWNCLYDQRGWLNLQRENYGSAYHDFEKALAGSGENIAMRAQPLEGMAQCCVIRGDLTRAAEYLIECINIRKQYFASDSASLGRVQFALGRIYDMEGRVQEAADAYGEAANLLDAAGESQQPVLIDVMFARAYALTQLRQWTDAAIVWDSLKKLLPANHERRSEIDVQLRSCSDKGAVLPSQVECDEDKEP